MGTEKAPKKKLCDKDFFAERSGELSGAICLKTLVALGNDPITPSNCSEHSLALFVRFFGFVSPFWLLILMNLERAGPFKFETFKHGSGIHRFQTDSNYLSCKESKTRKLLETIFNSSQVLAIPQKTLTNAFLETCFGIRSNFCVGSHLR